MPRWTEEEQIAIDKLRSNLGTSLTDRPQYPEVVGDRKLLRFLRGHDFNITKVTEMLQKHLQWRKDNHVDEIRDKIVNQGIDHPSRFPKGELILSLIPQVVIAPDAVDIYGSPVCVEQYNFSPANVLAKITIDEYILFTIYCLEYKSMIVEQLSHHQEQQSVKLYEDITRVTYGTLVYTCVIRDLNSVGFEHVGAKGREIMSSVIKVASDNYPELMRKCYMVNTPWLFNTVWYFIQGLLSPRTVAKVSVFGSNFRDELSKEIKKENVPALIGGDYTGGIAYTPFLFDKDYFNTPYVGTNETVAPPTTVFKLEHSTG